MAESIAEGVREGGAEPVVKEVSGVSAIDLLSYKAMILGTYTWGDGELPDEFVDFYEELDDISLEGRQAAVFGSGDSSYPEFCGAVDQLEQKLKERGSAIAAESLKLELDPSSGEKETCRALGRTMAGLLAAAGS
ncbi:flavodoxin [Paenibacillus beijingensis]|uniref:Flavodoxin n=2 Tax=Paenibacillus beijingensis TaxID=1126833 RepID=A0A0D5NQJ1_9BACL|nr:flavodoxin [Paenibacillus beijingensis]